MLERFFTAPEMSPASCLLLLRSEVRILESAVFSARDATRKIHVHKHVCVRWRERLKIPVWWRRSRKTFSLDAVERGVEEDSKRTSPQAVDHCREIASTTLAIQPAWRMLLLEYTRRERVTRSSVGCHTHMCLREIFSNPFM